MPTRTYPDVTGSLTNDTWGDVTTSYKTSSPGREQLVLSNDNGDFVSINAFEMNRALLVGGLINGYWSRPQGPVTFSGYPSSAYNNVLNQGWPAIGTVGFYVTRLVSNTNPTRADLGLPVFLAELRDIPGMIRHAGRLLLFAKKAIKRIPPSGLKPDREIASSWLAFNFGWAPLVSDLKKMINVSDLHSKRAKEFDRLFDSGGLKRRQTLDNKETDIQSWSYTHQSLVGGTSVAKGVSTAHVWGVVGWKPARRLQNDPLSRPTPMQVRRMVLGLSASNITANIWESLPWSWLTDYFTNFGDQIVANQGRHICYPEPAAIMAHSQTRKYGEGKFVVKNSLGEGVSIGDVNHLYEKKLRMTSHVSVEGSFGLLSTKQLSILGSLAALRVIPKLTR